MTEMIFVNLPVKDLAVATRFYEAIGCERNHQFSDDKASSMVWSETITSQLLARDYFATFTPKPVADAHAGSEVLLALSRDSRGDVDRTVKVGAAARGKADYSRAAGPRLYVRSRCRRPRWPCWNSRGWTWAPSGDAERISR
jgi:predicted lactoylglutathione lyase